MSKEEFSLESRDGTRLFAAHVAPEKTTIAHVVILHGYGEHLGRYDEVMNWFADEGYEAWAVDFRGHGRSAGHRAYVERYDLYLEDAQALLDHMADASKGHPVFLLGHSQGGLIGLRMLEEKIGSFKGAVLSAPAMQVALKANPIKVAAGKLLSKVIPKLNLPPEIPNTYLCRDPERVEAYSNDPLVNHCVNCRWFTEFLGAQEVGFAKAGGVTTPTMVVHPTHDQIISPASVAELFEKLGGDDKTLKPYEGFYHEPLNEPERRTVFEDILGWYEERREG